MLWPLLLTRCDFFTVLPASSLSPLYLFLSTKLFFRKLAHTLPHTHFRPHTHAEQAASYHKYADPKVSFCRLVACCIEITYIFLLQLARGETCNIPLSHSHSHSHSLSFFSFFPLFFAYFLFLCFFGYDIMKHGGRPGNLAALRERERKRETSSGII